MEDMGSGNLLPDEKQVARQLWEDLKHGARDAHDKLGKAPDKIRDAILGELAIRMDRWEERDRRKAMDRRMDNPFS